MDRALQFHPYKVPCMIHRFTYSLAQHVPYYWAGLAPRSDDLEMNYSSYPHGIQVDIRCVIFLPLFCPLQLLLPVLHRDFTSSVPESDLHRSCHIEKPARCHFSLSFPSLWLMLFLFIGWWWQLNNGKGLVGCYCRRKSRIFQRHLSVSTTQWTHQSDTHSAYYNKSVHYSL